MTKPKRTFVDKEFYGFQLPDRADAFIEWLKDRLDEVPPEVPWAEVSVGPQIMYDDGGDEYAGFTINYWVPRE